jgi:hypothetical protein
MWPRLNRGTAQLVAGAAAAAAPPILVLGYDWSIYGALGVAAGVFFGVAGILSAGRRREAGPAPGLNAGAIADARTDTANDLVREGEAALARLRQTGRLVRDELMREEIKLLTMKADRVLKEITTHPNKVMAVRRLLTFYLPNAASVAEGWRALEGARNPGAERVAQTRETMAALNDAFGVFADELHEPQMQTLDLDLRVLNDALKADLENARR